MCSIPGLPMPQSEASVVIARVSLNRTCDLVQLWVSMEGGHTHSYEKMREEIQTPERKFCGPEGKQEDLCLVCISDTWHRARIVSVQDETYSVFLIDQGKLHDTTSEALAWALKEGFVLPPEIESCILANVLSVNNSWSEKAREFFSSLPGKNFTGVVEHVLMPDRIILLDLPVVSAHLLRFGVTETVPAEEFKCLVLKSLHLLKEGTSEELSLTQEHKLNINGQLEKLDQTFCSEPLTGDYEPIANDDGLELGTFPNHEDPVVSDRTEDESTSDVNMKGRSKHLDPLVDNGENLSTGFTPERQNAPGDDGLTVGSSVGVKVSHFESPQMFRRRTTDNEDSFERLTQDLQKYYMSFHSQPLVESIFIARNPDDNMWHRARIIANSHSPVVDVRFLDYGQTQKIPLQDIRPIDPAFLQLNAPAVKCCLLSFTSPTKPCAVTHSDAALAEFHKFVDLGVSSETGLKRLIKVAGFDEEGPPLNSVDIETASDSASKSLSQKCEQSEAHRQVVPLVPSHAYPLSGHNIEVGGVEKIHVTSSETVNHFYCQLDRNSHLNDEVMKEIAQLVGQPVCADETLKPDSACLAKYPDNKWYRARVAEMSPKPKVHFVDFGDTLIVNESDVRPFPPQASVALSTPVLAVPLGLSGIPSDVPQEVNQWFADHAVGEEFIISVVAIEENGKLIVKLFGEPINEMVGKKVAQKKQTRKTTWSNQIDQQHQSGSKWTTKPNKVATKTTQPNEPHGRNTKCASEKVQMNSKSVSVCSNVSRCTYSRPNMDQNKITEAYATCIVGPNYFWCQQINSDDLVTESKVAQMAKQAQQDVFLKTLKPGSPCLALYSCDNQWYRAQVIRTADHMLDVLFVDYGNESKVDIRNVRPLPESLVKAAPQAFLCSLTGFDESTGSWDQNACDDFYSLLVDKQLKVTVVQTGTNSELGVPQYAVKIECDDTDINGLMQKYWRPSLKECANNIVDRSKTSPQDNQTECKITQTVSKRNLDTSLTKNQTITVYGSCISEPHFFWCQYSNTEELNTVLELAQEAGQTQQDMTFYDTLGPGSLCLALFSSDNRWYRAQVTQKVDDVFHVVFIDYGNEAEVEKENVRALTQSLLDIPPRALLCSLSGFKKSEGSWADEAYDDFYNLLVDKLLKLTLLGVEKHSENGIPQYFVEIDCEGLLVNTAMQKYWKPETKKCVSKEKLPAEDLLQDGQSESKTIQDCVSPKNVSIGIYKEPKISKNMTETVYASCIAEPHYFWCQHTNTEDLNKVLDLAQEAAQQDTRFAETLGPGSPCLALFSSDNRWYRAQVTRRVEDVLHVVFIDYGNELEVDINSVRSVPQRLLEIAPLAFLCSLNGFEKSKGSWADEGYDDFYSLLVDKPLRLTVVSIEHHSEASVPQYSVDVECEGVAVNTLMCKYWKEVAAEETGGKSDIRGPVRNQDSGGERLSLKPTS